MLDAFALVVDDFLLILVGILLVIVIIVIVVIIVVIAKGRKLAPVVGQVLESHIAVLELQGHRALALKQAREQGLLVALALEGDDYAFLGLDVIVVHEAGNPGLEGIGNLYGIDGAIAKVDEGITRYDLPGGIEGLEENLLVLREF